MVIIHNINAVLIINKTWITYDLLLSLLLVKTKKINEHAGVCCNVLALCFIYEMGKPHLKNPDHD